MPDERDPEDRPRRRRPAPDDEADDDDRPIRRSGPSDGGVGVVVPYRNAPALISYYVGILGLILCFLFGLSLFSGVTAVILGFMGFSRARKQPEAHGTAHAWVGIICGFVQILAACGWAAGGIAMLVGGKR
jgi:hypothetical protein